MVARAGRNSIFSCRRAQVTVKGSADFDIVSQKLVPHFKATDQKFKLTPMADVKEKFTAEIDIKFG